jgi:hypothetical protein
LDDLFTAGIGVTATGGHGTEYGVPIPTLDKAEAAQAFVDARIAEGSDYIKIIIEPGFPDRKKPRLIPTLSPETAAAVVAAAKKRGKMTVTAGGSKPDFVPTCSSSKATQLGTFSRPEISPGCGRKAKALIGKPSEPSYTSGSRNQKPRNDSQLIRGIGGSDRATEFKQRCADAVARLVAGGFSRSLHPKLQLKE